MKASIFIPLIFLLIPFQLMSQTEAVPQPAAKDSVQIAQSDSTEYELLVFDTGFETWLITNSRPVWYYENDHYRTKNQMYSINWNSRVWQAMHRPPYEYEIEYDPRIDYGVDLNWKLFWYFKYLEQKLGIRLN